MNNIFKIPAFQRRKAIPKKLKDLELLPLNEQFSKLTMSIVGDDDMRPVMTGNFFDMEKKKIVSTDAHKLTAINMPNGTFNFIKQAYNKELDKDPKGLIFHTLSQLQKDYNKLMKNNNISISFDEFVKDRAIEDGRYPNYEAVIPKEFTNEINVDYQKLYWYAKVLVDAKVIDDVSKINTSNANEYQNKKIEYLKDSYTSFLNPVTKQIILTYTLDGKQEYIGFNARLLCDLLKFAMEFNGKTFGKIGLSGNSRAMVIELENGLNVINDSVGIVMPVMLVSGEFDNTIGDSDFENNVAMYYDLDTNSIISDKENYPINESIGFMPNKAISSTPKIRVKEEVSKVENNSAKKMLDLIDTRIKGYKIALKVAKAENKANIEKKIKGLEIAKKMKDYPLPFAKGGNIGFKGLSNKVASNYEGKKVPQRFQSIYGKTYSQSEAQEVGNKVAGKVYREQQANKMADGGMVTYDINWEDENGDEYSESFDTIEEVNDLIKNIQKNGGRIIEKLKYIGDDFKGYFKNGGAVMSDGKFKLRGFPPIDKVELMGLYDDFKENFSSKIERFTKHLNKVHNSKLRLIDIKELMDYAKINFVSKGGMVEYHDYKGFEIMYEPTYEEYFVNDLVFNTLEKAKKYIDSGEANETPIYIENLYRRGAMAKGGNIDEDISWDIFIRDEYDNENFEINVRGYFENEEDAIKQAIKDYDIYVDESDYGKMYWNGNEISIYGAKKNYKKGGEVGEYAKGGEMSFSASEQQNWSKKKSFMYDLYVSHSNDLVDLKEYLKKAKNRKDTNEVKRLNIKKRNLEYSINYIKDKFSNYAKGGLTSSKKQYTEDELREMMFGKTEYGNINRTLLFHKYNNGKKDDGYETWRDASILSIETILKNPNLLGKLFDKIEYQEQGVTYPYNSSDPYTHDFYKIILTNGQSFTLEYYYGKPSWSGNVDYIIGVILKYNTLMPKKFAKGGSAVDGVYIDLFEDYENIPAEVQVILDEYSESFEDGDYIGMSKAQNELEQIGYTFDFYVDGDAYGLRPMNVKLSQLQGYEDEDEE